MARLRFTLGVRLEYESKAWTITKCLRNHRFELTELDTGHTRIASYRELFDALMNEELRFEIGGKNVRVDEATGLATEYKVEDLSLLPEKAQADTWYRFLQVTSLIEKSIYKRKDIKGWVATFTSTDISDDHIKMAHPAAVLRLLSEGCASRGALERWLKSYEESGHDIRSLIPSTYTGNKRGIKTLNDVTEMCINEILAEEITSKRKRTKSSIHLKVSSRIAEYNLTRPSNRQIPFPSLSTISRRIDAHPRKRDILGRPLSIVERKAHEMTSKGPQPQRILEILEMDHTLLDLIVSDEDDRFPIGRPWLTVALDKFSRMIFGFSIGFEPPSYYSIMNCLLHGILKKPDVQQIYGTRNPWPVYGIPETIVTDNGKDFLGKDLNHACALLGITLHQAPRHKAWYKGPVERFFGTLNTGLVHELPGTTDSNIQAKGDYDAVKNATISLSRFKEMLHVFLLDHYAVTHHTGIGKCPLVAWEEQIAAGFEPVMHSNTDSLRRILGRTAHRVIQRRGIQFENLFYMSPELAGLRARLERSKDNGVQIKVIPDDLGHIYVCDHTQTEHWFPVPAEDFEYANGLSLAYHRRIRAYQLENSISDEASRMWAKARVDEIVDEEFKLTKKTRKRAKVYKNKRKKAKPTNKTPKHPQDTAGSITQQTTDTLDHGHDDGLHGLGSIFDQNPASE